MRDIHLVIWRFVSFISSVLDSSEWFPSFATKTQFYTHYYIFHLPELIKKAFRFIEEMSK